ncbi:MAG: desulfoferrodoxin [Clostridia bacterium]|nr:desulfoferrodoxin [Clostridia bacterium]
MKQKFLKCEKCGAMVGVVKDCTCENCGIKCCGEQMKEIIPGTVDAAVEKHIPVYVKEGNKIHVTVGEIEHPMGEEHYIEWISIQTKQGNQRKALKPGDEPKACFSICENDEIEAIYAYCNLHGLWKA